VVLAGVLAGLIAQALGVNEAAAILVVIVAR
jgi:hypothetical protein